MRDPYAKALRVKPQQVIPDKRSKMREDLEALYGLDEDTPADMRKLLDKLK